jgi:hypothetical protein
MKIDITKILHKAGSETFLSEAEKAKLDAVILGYMSMKPLPVRPKASTRGTFMFIFTQRGYVAAGLVVAVAFSGTISYAAEGALPGDMLYPIKVGVNERIAVSLARAPEAKTALEARLAGKRLDEAARLAVEDRLTPERQAALSQNFALHAENAAKETEKLHDENESAAINAASSFESELESHESILASIDVRGDTESITRAVREKVQRVSRFRVEAEGRAFAEAAPEAASTSILMKAPAEPEKSGKKSNSNFRSVASKMGEAARKSYTNAEKQYAQNASAFDVSSTTIRSGIDRASQQIAEGDAHFSTELYVDAFHSYQGALSASQSMAVYMKTALAIRPQRLPESARFRKGSEDQKEGVQRTPIDRKEVQRDGPSPTSSEASKPASENSTGSSSSEAKTETKQHDSSGSGKSEDDIKVLNGIEVHL